VGKSRLVWEVTHSPIIAGWRVLKASSASYGKATSYLPVIDLLKGYFGIEDRDGLQEVGGKVTGGLLRLDRSLEPVVVPLLALLDVPVSDARWETLDPRQRRRSTLDALKQLLLREALNQPLLLIFEDLHWIDGETQALLDNLVESLPAARVLLLVNYRPEYSHAWGSKTYYRQLRIDPLPPESADELLDSLLGAEAALVPLKRLLIARTESVPLFLEESVRSLVETGALDGARGDYRLTRPIDQLRLPTTVQAILAARIDRLAPEAKRLLQAAAVVGKEVPLPLLLAIADAPEHAVRAELTRLQGAEFLYEVRLFPDLEYTFKHALTHEVTYQSLLQDRRRALHARVGEALELLYPVRLAEHTERLAFHTFRGEVWVKAAQNALQAGNRAAERSGVREAGRYGEQGLEALAHVPASASTLELALPLRHLVYHMYFALGARDQAVAWAKESVGIAETLGNKPLLAGAKTTFANSLWFTGQNAQALTLAEEAQNLAEAIGDTKTKVTTALDVGQICHTMGKYRRGVDVLARAVGLLKGDLAQDRLDRAFYPFVTLRSSLSNCLAELGDFLPAMVAGQEAIVFTESVQQPGTIVMSLLSLARPLLIRGEFLAAIPYLERAIGISKSEYARIYPVCAALLGKAYSLGARHAEAHVLLDEALAQVHSASPISEVSVMLSVTEGYMLAGRRHRALTIAPQALGLARDRSERGSEARALWLLAELASRPETFNVQLAKENYGKALSLGQHLDMRPTVAHCHFGLGKLHRHRGDREQAHEHLTTAMAMYREMDMTYWPEQAEAELRQSG
jgi:tetratricopeptide (TPR) repeat protein